MSNLIRAHQPCEDCGSHDAKSYYDDGSSYCFSCQRFRKSTGDVQIISEEEFEKKLLESIEKGKFRDIPDRGILKSTCEKYGVRTIQKNGVIVEHKYPYHDAKGNRIATKTRICATKEFYVEGSLKNCALFGQCLFPSSGKYLSIVEGECFKEDTEVLTREGWVSLRDYSEGPVMDGEGNFVNPVCKIEKDYQGTMIRISNKFLNIDATEGHNIIYRTKKGDFKKPFKDTPYDFNVPMSVDYDGPGIPLSDAMIQILVAISADGTIDTRRDGRKYIRISFLKERKIKRMRDLLNAEGIFYHEGVHASGHTCFCFYLNEAFKVFPTSWLTELSRHQRLLLLSELAHWDGYRPKTREQIEYYTIIKSNAEFVQTLAHLSGYYGGICVKHYKEANWSEGYTVRVCFNRQFANVQGDKVPYEYSGKVYCVQMPSSSLLVRSKGHIFVCGNCDALSVYQMFGGLYPVVSIPSGATSSKQAILNNYEWICGFDNIVLIFDADKAGQKGAKEIAQILPPDKVKIVKLDPALKDPNEYLKAGKTQEFISRWWKAEEYRPDDLVNIGDMFDRVKEFRKEHQYISTPWSGVNDKITGTRAGQLVVLASGCVDANTEFFSQEGWKKISDYKEGDKVLQYDQNTFEASLVEPSEYVKKSCDWFYLFKSKYGIDMALSPEHNVLYVPEASTKHYKMSAEELAQKGSKFRGRIPTSFKYSGEGIDLTDVEIKLMLAVIADSSICSSKSVMFHIKKQRKKDELKKILEEYGKPYNWYDRKDGYSDVRICPPRLEKEFTQDWYKCTQEQLQLICDNVLKWDGCTVNSRKQFSTTSKASADFVQFAFSSCGYRARICFEDRVGQTRGGYIRKSIEYSVYISDKVYVGLRNYSGPTKITSSDGFKYCFTVPTHCLVLRRNGCVFCTGNTGQGKSLFLRTWMDYVIKSTEEHIGALYMEEKPEETVISLMSLHAGKNLKKPEVWDNTSEDELKRFFDECGANRRIELFDPILSASPEYILDKIRYMYQARKCTVIFLDHITYLVDDSDDVRRDLNKLCKGLHDLCVSLGITIIAACHLRKSTDVRHSHEEGSRVTLDDLKDSSSIKQLSDVVIGLERDSQSENPLLANTTTIRVLKNRDFGDKGIACGAVYDKETTRLQEISTEELSAMKGGDEA